MANLAIKGHATRGKEVIEILKMLGGNNPYEYAADNDWFCFYIGYETRNICCAFIKNFENFEGEDMNVFTLEEFLEKFPYKVWDKVQHNGATSCGTVYVIERMKWANNHIEYEIRPLHDYNHTGLVTVCAEDLQPFEEETMEKGDKAMAPNLVGEDYSEKRFGYKIPQGYEFDCIQNNEIIIKPIKPKYPKTYEECCIIIGFNSDTLELNNPLGINKDTHSYIKHLDNLIDSFYKLIICRDAYWQIAGKQMGLEEPWQPNWNHINRKFYCIYNSKNNIVKNVIYSENKILVFPTAEMRDAFYENFKTLIEECKEVL